MKGFKVKITRRNAFKFMVGMFAVPAVAKVAVDKARAGERVFRPETIDRARAPVFQGSDLQYSGVIVQSDPAHTHAVACHTHSITVAAACMCPGYAHTHRLKGDFCAKCGRRV